MAFVTLERRMNKRWGSRGVCLKRTLPLAVLLLEKVQRKRQKKEKLNTTPSLKYSKTESLLSSLWLTFSLLVSTVDTIEIKHFSVPHLSPAKTGNKNCILLRMHFCLSPVPKAVEHKERLTPVLFALPPPQCLSQNYDSVQSVVGGCHGCSLVEAGSGHWIYQLYHCLCGSLAFAGGKDRKVFQGRSPSVLSTCSQFLICLNSTFSSCYLNPSFAPAVFPAFPCSWMCKCKKCWCVTAQRELPSTSGSQLNQCTRSRRHCGPPALFWVISCDLS